MSQNWGEAGEEGGFLDPLFIDFQLHTADMQCPSLDPVSQALFGSGNNHDHQAGSDPTAWAWTGDPSLPSSQAGQSGTQVAVEATERGDKHGTSEFAQRARDLESRLESRIAQFEEKVNTLQNR